MSVSLVKTIYFLTSGGVAVSMEELCAAPLCAARTLAELPAHRSDKMSCLRRAAV